MSEGAWVAIILLVAIGGLPFWAFASVKVVDGFVWLVCKALRKPSTEQSAKRQE